MLHRSNLVVLFLSLALTACGDDGATKAPADDGNDMTDDPSTDDGDKDAAVTTHLDAGKKDAAVVATSDAGPKDAGVTPPKDAGIVSLDSGVTAPKDAAVTTPKDTGTITPPKDSGTPTGVRDVNGPCKDLNLICFDIFDMFLINPECTTCNSGKGCQGCSFPAGLTAF